MTDSPNNQTNERQVAFSETLKRMVTMPPNHPELCPCCNAEWLPGQGNCPVCNWHPLELKGRGC